jgi:hypothetical protein
VQKDTGNLRDRGEGLESLDQAVPPKNDQPQSVPERVSYKALCRKIEAIKNKSVDHLLYYDI